MKNLFTTACVVLLFGISFAQNNGQGNGQGLTRWKTNGNNIDDTTRFIGTTNNKALRLKTNNTERIRISKEGNIGIGTSTPVTKLDVNGDVTLRKDLILKNIPLISPTEQKYHFVMVDSLTNKTHRGTKKDLIDYVYGKGCKYNNGGDVLSPKWSNGLNKIYSPCPQVNVGIGNNDPKQALHVSGRTATHKISVGSSASAESVMGYTKFSLEGYSPQLDKNLITVKNDQHDIFKINNQGKVEIMSLEGPTAFVVKNTIEGGEILRLDNDGLLRAREIRIDASEWADFVFEENYQLTPLEELASFIKKEKHLPNIPSSEEVAKEGIDLAEMNAKLLEKVEELTLYVIEQDKQRKEQDRKLEELQKEINQLTSRQN